MSVISKLIEDLKRVKRHIDPMEKDKFVCSTVESMKIIDAAINTIESLSAKLSVANMGRSADCSGWIPCRERLPEEKVNPVTNDFYEYPVTFKMGSVEDIRYYTFGNGHWWHGPGIMDMYVTAWREIPEPYHEP